MAPKRIKINHIVSENKISNFFLFKEIAPYLLNNNKFENLLEYGLLSKKCFELFKNLISFKSYELNFKIDFNHLENYIESSNIKNEENEEKKNEIYEKKLIQYKDIQCFNIGNSRCTEMEQYEKLKENCQNLKKLYIFDYVDIRNVNYKYGYDENEKDEEENQEIEEKEDHKDNKKFKKGFFVFNKLSLPMGEGIYLPISNQKEKNESNSQDLTKYQFSFEFLKKLKSVKKLHLSHLNSMETFKGIANILKCETIESIKFESTYPTPHEFLKEAIDSKNIKSLQVYLQSNDQEEYISQDVFKGLSKDYSMIKKLLLFLDTSFGQLIEQDVQDHLTIIFKYIKNHKTLKSLSLDAFKVDDFNLYKPLLDMPNIDKFYLTINKNYDQLLKHILINPNIIELQICHNYSTNEEIKQFIQPLKDLEFNSIKKITFVKYHINSSDESFQKEFLDFVNSKNKYSTNTMIIETKYKLDEEYI